MVLMLQIWERYCELWIRKLSCWWHAVAECTRPGGPRPCSSSWGTLARSLHRDSRLFSILQAYFRIPGGEDGSGPDHKGEYKGCILKLLMISCFNFIVFCEQSSLRTSLFQMTSHSQVYLTGNMPVSEYQAHLFSSEVYDISHVIAWLYLWVQVSWRFWTRHFWGQRSWWRPDARNHVRCCVYIWILVHRLETAHQFTCVLPPGLDMPHHQPAQQAAGSHADKHHDGSPQGLNPHANKRDHEEGSEGRSNREGQQVTPWNIAQRCVPQATGGDHCSSLLHIIYRSGD